MNANKFFFSLESLRGVAAIMVVCFHFFHNFGGHLAVDFFFVLSGFVLAHTYLYKDRMQIGSFIFQRILRLYPLHIFTLALFIACFYLYFSDLPSYIQGTKRTFIQHLFLMQNVGFNRFELTWNYPSWSISTEFVISLLFIFFIRKWQPTWAIAIVAAACYLMLFKYNVDLNVHRENLYYINEGLLRCLGGFLVGILSYRAYQQLNIRFAESIKDRFFVVSLFELATLLMVIAMIFIRPSKYYITDFLSPFLFFAMIVVYAFDAGIISRALYKIKYLGVISYSIYLNHVPLFLLFAWAMEKIGFAEAGAMKSLYTAGYPYAEYKYLVLAVYLIALFVMSHFTYKYVENFIRQQGRRLTTKKK